MEDADITDNDVAREFEADGFVSPTGLDCVARIWITERTGFRIGSLFLECIVLFFRTRLAAASYQSLSPDATGTKDRDVLEVLAPDQTVVPVTVTEVLILVPRVRLWQILFAVAVTWIGGEDRRALIDVERDVAFQANRKRAVSAGSE